jgi:hypothetical protein
VECIYVEHLLLQQRLQENKTAAAAVSVFSAQQTAMHLHNQVRITSSSTSHGRQQPAATRQHLKQNYNQST